MELSAAWHKTFKTSDLFGPPPQSTITQGQLRRQQQRNTFSFCVLMEELCLGVTKANGQDRIHNGVIFFNICGSWWVFQDQPIIRPNIQAIV